MFRRYFRNRNITFDKTMWMEWNEKVKFCILVINFLKHIIMNTRKYIKDARLF